MAASSPFDALDRGLYALFSRHADRVRHERDRSRYRAAALGTGFDLFLARVYGLSWLAFVLGVGVATAVGLTVPAALFDAISGFVHSGFPVVNRVDLPDVPRVYTAVLAGWLVGIACKRLTVIAGGRYLQWVANARRAGIERTLPGAVRYLWALAAGSDNQTTLVRKVAEQEAYGETSVAFRTALNRAALTGSLDEGLRMVARDTPSRDTLAPFLLKFQEHASQGSDALAGYLEMESRMLSHKQARARQRANDFLELLAELFIVLLVLPALLVIIVTVLAVLAPGLSERISTPVEPLTVRAVIVYASALFVLVVGLIAAWLIDDLRPADQAPPKYSRPDGFLRVVMTVPSNPASALVAAVPVGLLVAAGCYVVGYGPVNVLLLGYAAFALPVGAVAVRRANRDAAKDREMRDFVHAVAGHVSLGRPFGQAVARVVDDVDLGALQGDVEDLAFNLSLSTTSEGGDVRSAALDRFTERVGTPLAAQTMGLVTGALDVGSDAEAVFDTLQTEVGRLHHEKRALRSSMLVYVAVGWTTALLVIGIVVAVNTYVLDGFAQLSAVSGARSGLAIDPDAVNPARDQFRFYVVTQATMLACGWFAGIASRGRHEALLHSGLLVVLTYVVFAGAGMV